MNRPTVSPMVNTVCSVLFLLFTFIYIFCFQCDLLAYGQQVLSGGMTTYSSFVGATIITILVGCLALLTASLTTRALYYFPALFFLPSSLLLASLTDIDVAGDDGRVVGGTWIVAIVVLLLFIPFVRFIRTSIIFKPAVTLADSMKNLWINLVIILGLIAFVTSTGNTNEQLHLQLKTEQLNMDRKYAKVVEMVGNHELTSAPIAMNHALALAKCGTLGESFFENLFVTGAGILFPNDSNRLLLMPSSKIYQFVGGVPSPGMEARECLRLLNKRGQLKSQAKDYLYTACLLDRDLESFVNYLSNDSSMLASLPKHYREALTLYNHLHTSPVIDFAVPEMEADYNDFQDLIKKNPNKTLRYSTLRDSYGNTYWFYYFFTSAKAFTQSVSREN